MMRCGSNDKVNPVPYVLFCSISFIASKLIWRSINCSYQDDVDQEDEAKSYGDNWETLKIEKEY